METKKPATSMWAEALKLARQGIPVFPCGADKRPLTPHGFKDATCCDSEIIHTWWTAWPDALIGVPTGERFTVLDVDCAKHVEAAQWYGKANLPLTRTHITRSGGRHLLFTPGPPLTNSVSKLCKGVDVRAAGGYIIWWPACGLEVLHADALAEMPNWLIEQLLKRPSAEIICFRQRPFPPTSAAAQHKINGIIRAIAHATEGERNSLTFWGACRLAELVAQGILNRSDAVAIAVEAASRNGLPRREALRTAQSAFQNRA